MGSFTFVLERSVDYSRKMAQPKRASIRFTGLFYVLIILGVVAIGTLVYFYLQGAFKLA